MALDPTQIVSNDVKTPNQITTDQLDLNTKQLTQARDQATTVAQLMQMAVSQPTYDAVKQHAQKLGIDTSDEPPNFDPDYVAHIRMMGLTAAQQFNNQLRLLATQAKAGEAVGDPTQFGAFTTQSGMPGAFTLKDPGGQQPQQPPQPVMQGQPAFQLQTSPPPLPAAAAPPTALDPLEQYKQNLQQQPAPGIPAPAQLPAMQQPPPMTARAMQGPNETVSHYKARMGPLPEGSYINDQGQVAPVEGAKEGVNAIAGAKTSGEEQGKKSTEIVSSVNDEASQALATKRMIAEMKQLSNNFTSGNFTNLKSELGSWAISMGFDKKAVNDALGNVASMQDFPKFTTTLATLASKNLTSRPAVFEFSKYLETNPNAAMTPDALATMMDYMDKTQDVYLDKQAFLQDWKKGKSPKDIQEDFEPAWTQRMRANMQGSLSSPEGVKAAAPTSYKEGATATNPKTKEKMIFTNGNWKALR